jgi:hypothetical protein
VTTAFQAGAFQENAFQIDALAGSATASVDMASFASYLLLWKRRRIKKRHAQLKEVAEVVTQVLQAEASTRPVPPPETAEPAQRATEWALPLHYEPMVIAERMLQTDSLETLRKIKRADVMMKRIQDALDEIDDEEVLLLLQ